MVIIFKYWFFLIPSLLFSPSLHFPSSSLTPFSRLSPGHATLSKADIFSFLHLLMVDVSLDFPLFVSRLFLPFCSLTTRCRQISHIPFSLGFNGVGGRGGFHCHRAEKEPGKWRCQSRTFTQQRVCRWWCSETVGSRWRIVFKQPAHFQNTDC